MKNIITTITFSCFITIAWSQSSGSLYSSFGIGNLHPTGIGQQEGLGNTGIGLRSPFFINTSNPAANVFMKQPATMMLDIGLYLDGTFARSESERAFQNGGGLSYLTLWMQPNRYWGTVLGIAPFSEVNYNFQADRFNEIVSADYSVIYKGSGGLNKFFWSNSFAPFKNLSVGANVNFLFGAIERTEEVTTLADITNFSTLSTTNFLGVQFDAGIQYSFRMNGNQLVLGATFTPNSNVSSLVETVLRNTNNEILTSEEETAVDYQLPMQTGFGVSWNMPRLLLASDINFQQWTKARLDTDENLKDTWKWSVGAEWTPLETSYLFFQQPLLLRGGFFIQNYHQAINGNTFPIWGASAGISLPVRRKLHHLNINYTFQQRGTKADNLLLESTHRLSLSVTFRDTWFQKQRFN